MRPVMPAGLPINTKVYIYLPSECKGWIWGGENKLPLNKSRDVTESHLYLYTIIIWALDHRQTQGARPIYSSLYTTFKTWGVCLVKASLSAFSCWVTRAKEQAWVWDRCRGSFISTPSHLWYAREDLSAVHSVTHHSAAQTLESESRRDLKSPTQYQEVWPSSWGKEMRLGWEFKYIQEQILVLKQAMEFPSPSVHGQVRFTGCPWSRTTTQGLTPGQGCCWRRN